MKNKMKKAMPMCPYTTFAARLLLASIFVNGLIGKLMNPSGTIAFMESKGFFFTEFFFLMAIIILAAGSLSLILGYKTCIGSALLAFYTLLTVLIFHFSLSDINLFKNLAIIGGLLVMMQMHPGKIALEK